MNTTTAAAHSSTDTPGNRKDRERFAVLSPWDQAVVVSTVARLYDGTRTVAQCWKLALDAVEEIA